MLNAFRQISIARSFVFAILLLSGVKCQGQYPEINYRLPSDSTGRQYLFGNWNGLRTDLENKGITFEFENLNDNLWVLHGGASNQGTAWERIRGTIDVDFGKCTRAKGLRFHATALWQTGNNVALQLNSFANPSGEASVHVFRMDSYWLEDTFAHQQITLRVGQMAGWDFYGTQEYGNAFVIEPLDYAFANMFDATWLTYNPAGVPAVQLLYDRAHKTANGLRGFYAQSGIFSGNHNPYVQDPTGLHFKVKNSPTLAEEIGYQIDAAKGADQSLPRRRKLYPGIYRLGTSLSGSFFKNQLTQSMSKKNYLVYVLVAQAVYRAERGSNRGLDVTYGYDFSPNDVDKQNAVTTAGGVYHGLIPKRAADDFSVGFVATRVGNAASLYSQLNNGFPLGTEKAYTVDYRAQIKPWLVVQPTAQYFTSIAGNPHRSSGVVIGFRTYLRL